jgi:hypothetical protein
VQSAGFHGIDISDHSDLLRTPEDRIPEEVNSALRIGAVHRMLEGAGAEIVERVRAAIDETMRSRIEGGEVALSRSFFLVRAEA